MNLWAVSETIEAAASVSRTSRMVAAGALLAAAILAPGTAAFGSPTRVDHYSYLVRQMRSLAASHRLNVDPDLVRFLDSFETDEITAVADYLSRMRGPTRDRSKLNDDGTLRD